MSVIIKLSNFVSLCHINHTVLLIALKRWRRENMLAKKADALLLPLSHGIGFVMQYPAFSGIFSTTKLINNL